MAAHSIIENKILNCTPASLCRRPRVSLEIRLGRMGQYRVEQLRVDEICTRHNPVINFRCDLVGNEQ
eukprot:3318113-Rhodomonas_salina.1